MSDIEQRVKGEAGALEERAIAWYRTNKVAAIAGAIIGGLIGFWLRGHL